MRAPADFLLQSVSEFFGGNHQKLLYVVSPPAQLAKRDTQRGSCESQSQNVCSNETAISQSGESGRGEEGEYGLHQDPTRQADL